MTCGASGSNWSGALGPCLRNNDKKELRRVSI